MESTPDLAELAERVAALEQRLTAGPLAANPPITIGSFTNVPAPGSAILSAWAQDATKRVNHQFASAALANAWAAADGSYCTVANRLYIRIAGAWQGTAILSFVKNTVGGGFINYTAAEFGFAKFLAAGAVTARRSATDTVFLVGSAISADGTTGSLRAYYVDAGRLLQNPGDGTPITVDAAFIGTL